MKLFYPTQGDFIAVVGKLNQPMVVRRVKAAMQMSDNETAAQLHKARQQLFKQIHEQSSRRPGSRRP
ncbi:MAG: hypothetical protein ACREX3_09705 [Gammaproteobacteria bacterium]